MKVYLDNMFVCKIIKPDLVLPDEQKALDKLRKNPLLEIVTSRESWREQEKTRYQSIRDQYRQNRDKIPFALSIAFVFMFISPSIISRMTKSYNINNEAAISSPLSWSNIIIAQ